MHICTHANVHTHSILRATNPFRIDYSVPKTSNDKNFTYSTNWDYYFK